MGLFLLTEGLNALISLIYLFKKYLFVDFDSKKIYFFQKTKENMKTGLGNSKGWESLSYKIYASAFSNFMI